MLSGPRGETGLCSGMEGFIGGAGRGCSGGGAFIGGVIGGGVLGGGVLPISGGREGCGAGLFAGDGVGMNIPHDGSCLSSFRAIILLPLLLLVVHHGLLAGTHLAHALHGGSVLLHVLLHASLASRFLLHALGHLLRHSHFTSLLSCCNDKWSSHYVPLVRPSCQPLVPLSLYSM